MKRFFPIFLVAMVWAAPLNAAAPIEASDNPSLNNMTDNQITIKVGNTTTLTATLADNSSASALLEMLKAGPVSIDMHDYANMEKVGSLPRSLPRNDTYFSTGPGDLVLYLGNQFVIYYDTNAYTFTRLGKVNGNYSGSELKSILGNGNVTVSLSAGGSSGISDITADTTDRDSGVYDLEGRRVLESSADLSSLATGIYIIDGKKTAIERQ